MVWLKLKLLTIIQDKSCGLDKLDKLVKTMFDIPLNPDQLEILKSAITKSIRDHRAKVSEFLAEVIEDIAMERAIAEGEATALASRD